MVSRRNKIIEEPETDERRDFANWLALIAASSIGLLVFARGASFDIILTFPITASLVGFFIFDQAKDEIVSARRLPLDCFLLFYRRRAAGKRLGRHRFPARHRRVLLSFIF